MRLIRLQLKNVAQHASLDWEFGPGLIGIFGANGSGKSNSINAGCYAALTNDFSRVCGGRSGAVRQQARPEEVSRIVLHAEHQGTTFEIMRQLSPSVKHQMTVAGEKPITKATEIQQRLEQSLGIQRRLIDDYVFVHQRALTEFLSATPAIRAKSFAHLCNTVHAEKCWTLVGDQIEADRGLAAEVVDDTDEIRKQIGEYESRRRELEKSVRAAKKKLLKSTDIAKYKKQVENRHRYDFLCETRPGQVKRVAIFLEQAKKAVAAHKKKLSELRTQEAAYRRTKDRSDDAQSKLDCYTRDKEIWEHREARRQEWEKAIKLEPSEPDSAEVDTRMSIHNMMAHKANRQVNLDKFLKWIETRDSGAVECESCGAALKGSEAETARRFKEAEKGIPRLESEIKVLETKEKTRRVYDKAKIQYDALRAAWHERVSNAEDQYRKYEEREKPEKIDTKELQQIISEADDLYSEVYGDDDDGVNGLKGKVDQADREKEQYKSRHQEAKARLAETDKGLSEGAVSDKDFDAAGAALVTHAAVELSVRTDQARLGEVKGFIEVREKELARVERVMARSQKARGWVAMLETVRGVLHRDQLPRVVHHNALSLMQNGINKTLEEFDSPFRIAPEEDLSLTATFPDGTVIAGEGLSGGQQAVLALAFRWTLGSLFASQIGMLVLDEPTAGLDDRNLDCLETALIGLGRVAKDRGYQVVIITHEERLERVFDQVLTLEKITQ